MISFKQFLIEKKDHLIKKLKNLSSSEKTEIIDFFKKKPNLEGKIDWNNKNLTYDDFKDVMGETKTSRVKKVKTQGIKGLKEGEDYFEINIKDPGIVAYIPVNYEASKLIASKNIGPCEGKWCTAYQKSDEHWIDYITKDVVFVYLITPDTKYAIAVYPTNTTYSIFDANDKKLNKLDINVDIKKEILSQKAIFDKVRLTYDKTQWIKNADIKNAKYIINKRGEVIWLSGLWIDGTWKDGIWKSGMWERGAWEDGTWETGTWQHGYWEGGTWITGIWEWGEWGDGTWKGGLWEDGSWEFGVWEDGTWKNGTWWTGTWLNGTWEDGIWKDGTWEGGTWLNGTWEGGTWRGGYDKNGNFHESGDSPDEW